ncbi:MAG: hypothetical protein IKK38_14005 [Spirochaetaceae bacterium]|nr:hypothetical protein [Spirochaetaceae bacterium]
MIFDFSKGGSIMPMNDNMGMDNDGNLHMRVGDNCSMDMNNGELHFTSSWGKQKSSHSSFSRNNIDDFDDDF